MALLVFAAQMQQLGLGWKTWTLKFEGLANDYIYIFLIYFWKKHATVTTCLIPLKVS